MPNPKKYKNKKKWMQDCLHQTLHVEKKNKDQGVAECLNRWRQEKAIKIASLFLTKQSDIKKDLKKIKKSDKPSIFLGGVCKNDQWRNELKKEFPYFVFIDPYDPDWEPEDNIYDELTGLFKAGLREKVSRPARFLGKKVKFILS